MVDKLEACPFCGDEAAVIESGERFYVTCMSIDCYAALGEVYDRDAMPDHHFAEMEGAIAAWNTRATPANGEQVERDEMAKRLFWADTMLGENADRIQPEWRDKWWDELATMPLSGAGFLRKWRALADAATPTTDARERVKVLEEALGNLLRYIGHDGKRVYSTDLVVVKAILALGNKETDRHG